MKLAHSHVGTGHAAELLLQDGEEAPDRRGEGLGVQHAQGAATLGERSKQTTWVNRQAEMAIRMPIELIHPFNSSVASTSESQSKTALLPLTE